MHSSILVAVHARRQLFIFDAAARAVSITLLVTLRIQILLYHSQAKAQ